MKILLSEAESRKWTCIRVCALNGTWRVGLYFSLHESEHNAARRLFKIVV